MKVLFQTRPDFQKNPAGDTVQMMSTGQNLSALGLDVSLSTDPNLDLSPYDIIHIFNLTRIKESYLLFLNAQKQKKKIVVSPIYWPPHAYLKRPGANSNALAVWQHMQPMRARLVREADLLLPNAESEMAVIQRDFVHTAPYQVIANGFPDSYSQADPTLFRKQFPNLPADFILLVARISPRKNQDWLARICNELNLPLILVGPINDTDYARQLRTYSNVTHLGVLQGELLASAYTAAKAHALPSWFETPGLSSLEAGACGTVVISTDQGSTCEYFQDMALYVRPLEDDTLRHALTSAFEASPSPLTHHIRTNYPWSKVAQKTLEAYQLILNQDNSSLLIQP